MEIHQLRSFVTVADSGGVSKAARRLHLAQPAVSQHLRSLERELGVSLFERGGRGMQLTDAGLALLGQAREVLTRLSDLRTAADRFTEEANNQVAVAMTPSMAASLVPAILSVLRVSSTKIRLVLYERPTEDCLALLAAGSVAMAVIRDAEGSGVHLTPLFEEPLVLAVSSDNPVFEQHDTPSISDFRDESFVFFRHTGRETLFQGAYNSCLRAGFTPKTLCEGVEADSMREVVLAGMAACIAPLTVVRMWPQGRVRLVTLDAPAPRSTAYLARVEDRVLPQAGSRIVKAISRAARPLAEQLATFDHDLNSIASTAT